MQARVHPLAPFSPSSPTMPPSHAASPAEQFQIQLASARRAATATVAPPQARTRCTGKPSLSKTETRASGSLATFVSFTIFPFASTTHTLESSNQHANSRIMFHGCPPSPDAWGRLNVVTPFEVVQHGKRADAIVKNMLLHSRRRSGEHRLVDANALVEESLNLAYHGARAEKQGFKINMERFFDPAAGQVDVYPQEITRALLNLISNGFYAASKRKEQDKCEATMSQALAGGDKEPWRQSRDQNSRQRHRHSA